MLDPEQLFLPQLTALHSRTNAAFGRVVGMHLSRFRILFLLHLLGESSPGTLLKWSAADPAALTRIMKDFEADGLLVRRPDPADARARLVALTEAGAARIQQLLPLRERFISDVLGALTPEEVRALTSLMRRVESSASALAGLPALGESFDVDPSSPGE